MKDFTIICLFFLEMLLAILIAIAFVCRCRFLSTFLELEQRSLKRLKNKDLPLYYSTSTLKKIALNKVLHRPTLKADILSLMAMKNIDKTAPLIRQYVKRFPNNINLLLLDAEISLLQHNQADFEHVLEQITLPRLINPKIKAKYYLLLAQNKLYQTDMLSASTYASKALKIYQKNNYLYEEAMSYQTLAQIYRISGVFDVAFTMLKEAQKIYKKIKLSAKIAETEAYLGLVEMGRENYKPAENYLENAAKICIKNKLTNTLINIKNWQGLILFIKKQSALAKVLFDEVLEKALSPAPKAFAAEMLARIYITKKDFDMALKLADKALIFAKTQKHYPSIFENLYLKAEAYYALEKYAESRHILTELIKTPTPPSAIYYPANAYTLLGLIEVKENNLNMACSLFKQALDLEHSQNRLKGAAIDYNNLAELSSRQGLTQEAEKYLGKALNYAKEIDDKELIKFLKSKQ